MVAATALEGGPAVARGDGEQRFLLHGVAWDQYVALRKLLDDRPGLRLTYYKGWLELMSPSPAHENIKTLLARLLEVYALVRGVRLHGYGSTTYRRKRRERGHEPDECYFVGTVRKTPDLAIEVEITRGALDKLAVYAGLGVPEVWIWRNSAVSVFRLAGEGYVPAPRSVALPALDLGELARFARMPDQADAVAAYHARLLGTAPKTRAAVPRGGAKRR